MKTTPTIINRFSLAIASAVMLSSSLCWAGEEYYPPAEPSGGNGAIQWQDFSLTYLYGEGFTVDPEDQHTLTVEYAAGLTFGDLFSFTDFTYYLHSDESMGVYGEFSPRFSYNKIFGQNFAIGPVSDALLATTLEYGSGPVETFLAGPAIDLEIPGFKFFQLNLYYRMPLRSDNISDGWQLTAAWSVSFPVGSSEIVFDGFADWVFVAPDSDYSTNFHFSPQLKYNLGKLLWGEDAKLYVGIEYRYWLNKYGIKDSKGFDTDDNVVSFLVKYHF